MDTPTALAIAFLVIITLGYLLTCAAWPYANCHRCDGTGKIRAPLGRAFRLCPRCKHTGRRLRLGRRAYNHWQRVRHDARSR